MPLIYIFKLSFLNLFRNIRRSIITLLAITIGSIALVTFGGYTVKMYEGLGESFVSSGLGHLQIFKEGYDKNHATDPEGYLLTVEETEQIKEVLDELPHTALYTMRLSFYGLLSNGYHSIGVLAEGVEPELDLLINSFINITEGDSLLGIDAEETNIGRLLAKNLNTNIGDVQTLLASTVDGLPNAIDTKITGYLNHGFTALDERVLKMPITQAQLLLNTNKVTNIVVQLEDDMFTTSYIVALKEKLAELGLVTEIVAWTENSQAEFYHQVVNLYDNIFTVVQIIVLMIVFLNIVNTMSMTIMERTQEIGTIRAVGTKRVDIISLFMMEAIWLGLIGSLIGLSMGYGISEAINAMEIMMDPPPSMSKEIQLNIAADFSIFLKSLVLNVTAVVLSSLFSAFKASRINIVDALRYV